MKNKVVLDTNMIEDFLKEHIIGPKMKKEENENYSTFEKPFKPAKRIKVSTFKVSGRGKEMANVTPL